MVETGLDSFPVPKSDTDAFKYYPDNQFVF